MHISCFNNKFKKLLEINTFQAKNNEIMWTIILSYEGIKGTVVKLRLKSLNCQCNNTLLQMNDDEWCIKSKTLITIPTSETPAPASINKLLKGWRRTTHLYILLPLYLSICGSWVVWISRDESRFLLFSFNYSLSSCENKHFTI